MFNIFYDMVSHLVCLSVYLSVTLVYPDHSYEIF